MLAMSSFWRLLACAAGVFPATSLAYAQPRDQQAPCEAYSQSVSVFIGQAGAPVRRSVQLPGHPPLVMTVTPVAVERAFLGVTTSIIYLTPLGVQEYATPGRTYLVYGRRYQPPDIVMASPGYGAKKIEQIEEDLAFLDALTPGKPGGTITGIVQQKEASFGETNGVTAPLGGIPVRIFNDRYATEIVTGFDGRFYASGIPAGLYQLVPQFPEGLVARDSTSRIEALVRDGGCATSTVDAVFNGRVRGILRGPDGSPLPRTSVDLMPIDVAPDGSTGHIKGAGSVSTNAAGAFEFAGRSAARYFLGVGLFSAPSPNGPSYPRTYYPGTTDPASAVPIVVERGRVTDGLDFSVPMVLPKGELEVIVQSEYAGVLKICFVPLEDRFKRRTSETVQMGAPYRRPVVDGQRYQVHAHLEFPGGHFESEPYVFTATTGTTIVTLRPDSPRTLHP
jgi:hypothetical protein